MSLHFSPQQLIKAGYVERDGVWLKSNTVQTKETSLVKLPMAKIVRPEVIQTTDTITFEILPLGKPRMTQRDRWKKRPVILRYYAFKDELNRQAAEKGFKLADTFDIQFVIPMPPSWSNRKRSEMNGQPHRQRPDFDNLAKAACDCLMVEDSSVHMVLISKIWGVVGKIIIKPLDTGV